MEKECFSGAFDRMKLTATRKALLIRQIETTYQIFATINFCCHVTYFCST